MNSGMIGHVEHFQPGVDDWEQYEERLQQYFVANGISNEEKKRAILLTVVGSTTYGLLSNLVAPAKPAAKTYAELVTALKDHLKPKPLVIAERFRFHRRDQAGSESVAEYLTELRKLVDKCNFRDYLEEALRDRLVCGLKSEVIQRRLLTEEGLTLKKAYETAVSMETAAKGASELQRALPQED